MTGIEGTWKTFTRLNPWEVRQRTGVDYDAQQGVYRLHCFAQEIMVSAAERRVRSNSAEGVFLLGIKDYFFDLSVLWYLISAQDSPLSQELIKPAEVPGGQIFVKGTHVLPMERIAERFNHRREEFLAIGRRFGSSEMAQGDAGLTLYPFPRLPVHLILWFGDEDFPASGQLLLDKSAPTHLATDVLWAVTMVCCLIFLEADNW